MGNSEENLLTKKIVELGLLGLLKDEQNDLEFIEKRIEGYEDILSGFDKPLFFEKTRVDKYKKKKKEIEDILDRLYKEKELVTEEISSLYEELLEEKES